jgi:hypothetical protein
MKNKYSVIVSGRILYTTQHQTAHSARRKAREELHGYKDIQVSHVYTTGAHGELEAVSYYVGDLDTPDYHVEIRAEKIPVGLCKPLRAA